MDIPGGATLEKLIMFSGTQRSTGWWSRCDKEAAFSLALTWSRPGNGKHPYAEKHHKGTHNGSTERCMPQTAPPRIRRWISSLLQCGVCSPCGCPGTYGSKLSDRQCSFKTQKHMDSHSFYSCPLSDLYSKATLCCPLLRFSPWREIKLGPTALHLV